MSKLSALLVAAMFSTGVAVAGSLENGLALYKRGDYFKAYGLILPLADEGNPAAQFIVASMYRDGQGVAKDDVQAVNWYRKAAEQGHPGAEENLGLMYLNGRGVTQDDAQAAYWFRKAAEQGMAPAQNDLGTMYFLGRGVQKDVLQAYKWILLASLQGQPNAIKSRAELEKAMTPQQRVAVQSQLLTPEQLAAVQAASPAQKPPDVMPPGPVPVESEMLSTVGGGFILELSANKAKPSTLKYGLLFDLKRTDANARLAVIEFENPTPGAAPIVVEQAVAAGETEINVASPQLAGIAPHRNYKVVLTLYSDSTKKTVIATHAQEVQSPDVTPEAIEAAGLKAY